MKQSIYIFFILLFSVQISSCIDDNNYAVQQKAEKTAIADYIKRNSITVVSKLPDSNKNWDENTYYLAENGLYFHLESVGDTTGLVLEKNDLVVCRYIQYTLSIPSDTISKWTPNESPVPISFLNDGNYSALGEAFHQAASYMKYSEAIAKIIVPSKIGFPENKDAVIPYGYVLKIRIQK
jgi:hypothetical protein